MKTTAVVSFGAQPERSTQPRQQKTIAAVKDAPTRWLATTTRRCVDDGSCSTAGFCIGCTTPMCNYEPNATVDNGTCDYLDEWCRGGKVLCPVSAIAKAM